MDISGAKLDLVFSTFGVGIFIYSTKLSMSSDITLSSSLDIESSSDGIRRVSSGIIVLSSEALLSSS